MAQTLQLKVPDLSLAVPAGCPAVVQPAGPVGARPAMTDSLLAEGSSAAILGNHEAASAILRQAAALDPADPVIAYRLARSLEEEGHESEALKQYCTYLALRPNAPEATELRRRVLELAETHPEPNNDAWSGHFVEARTAYEEGRYEDAVSAFSRIISDRWDWPDAHFNRGVAFLAAGRTHEAAEDFGTYLQMAPGAYDREEVLLQLAELGQPVSEAVAQSRPPDSSPIEQPSKVLLRGLIVPGFAQHATGRSALALAVFAGAGGAMYLGFREQTVLRRQGAYDPFGNFYEFEVTSLDRPYQTAGTVAAIGISVAAALEGYVYARRHATASPRIASLDSPSAPSSASRRLTFSASPNRVAFRISVR